MPSSERPALPAERELPRGRRPAELAPRSAPMPLEDLDRRPAASAPPPPPQAAPPPPPLFDQAELDRRLAAARAEALERGRGEGHREAQAEAASLAAQVEAAFAQLHQGLRAAERETTRDAVRLATLLAEKIVRQCLSRDPEAMAQAVLGALEATEEGPEPLRILCDPSTAQRLRGQFSDLAATLKVSAVVVQEDPKLAAGDFMLYRGSSTVDARLLGRLRRIERALARELGLELAEP